MEARELQTLDWNWWRRIAVTSISGHEPCVPLLMVIKHE
jgi:hypothetical protein